MAGKPDTRATLERAGLWEEYRMGDRERRRALRREAVRVAWREELTALLRETGDELSPAVLDYLVERMAESNRVPSRAGARLGMAEVSGDRKAWEASTRPAHLSDR
jgi:hypothetical protein